MVQLLGITANNKVDLVRDYLPQLLPQLYQQTVVDQSLIRTVDLGPFKHTQDDGLSLRKAAFESLEFLLDNAPETLQFSEFVSYLQNGIVVSPLDLLLERQIMLRPNFDCLYFWYQQSKSLTTLLGIIMVHICPDKASREPAALDQQGLMLSTTQHYINDNGFWCNNIQDWSWWPSHWNGKGHLRGTTYP